jgi:Ca2+-binding EF-hand superfamily protein
MKSISYPDTLKECIMQKFISSLIVTSLLFSFGTALAADKTVDGKGRTENPHKSRLKFDDCDKSNKGFLTFEEAQACWPNLDRKTFDAIDTNKDGKITKEKLKANRERHAKAGQKME